MRQDVLFVAVASTIVTKVLRYAFFATVEHIFLTLQLLRVLTMRWQTVQSAAVELTMTSWGLRVVRLVESEPSYPMVQLRLLCMTAEQIARSANQGSLPPMKGQWPALIVLLGSTWHTALPQLSMMPQVIVLCAPLGCFLNPLVQLFASIARQAHLFPMQLQQQVMIVKQTALNVGLANIPSMRVHQGVLIALLVLIYPLRQQAKVTTLFSIVLFVQLENMQHLPVQVTVYRAKGVNF